MTFNLSSVMVQMINTIEQDENVSNIIDYWNTELLCSLDSSTSHTDPDMAFLDNAIENVVLCRVLKALAANRCKCCLDVGAGYGRFVPTWRDFFSEIVMLEASDKIYNKLKTLYQHDTKIECHHTAFEKFVDRKKYNLIFASGVLYLYNDGMVKSFIEQSKSMLAKNGLLILREFVAHPQKIIRSGYVKDGYCYYRTSQFWRNAAVSCGFELLNIIRSKPRLAILRNSRFLAILSMVHFKSSLRNSFVREVALKYGDWRLSGNDIQTVFIVMRAL